MAILKKIVSILSDIGFILLLIYALIASPIIFGYHPVVILTGSMSPSYKVGTVVYYYKVSEDELKEGDFIAFKNRNDKVISHRINSIEGSEYITKGDANDTVDVDKVSFDNILGKITKFKIPIIGYYIWFVNQHLYVVAIFILLIFIDFLLDVKFKKNVNKVSN